MQKLAVWVIFALCAATSFAQDSRDLCEDGKGKFDTIFSTPDGKVYIIKGDKLWELEGDKDTGFDLKPGYPVQVQQMWPGLPSTLDVAFTDYSAQKTYFFKDGQMYVYSIDRKLESGYPKSIASTFPGLPNQLDGAFICTGYNYFFKGNKYYGASGNSGDISSKWIGLPNDMHAAVQFASRGHTYFFKDYQYYKYRVWNGPVEAGYPKDVASFWFKCDQRLDVDARSNFD